MKSIEKNVSSESEYFIYSPSQIAQKTFLYPIQCGMFHYLSGYRQYRERFDSFLILYLKKGTATLQFQGQECKVKAHDFVLIDCYEPHGYYTDEGYECLWVHFGGVLARNLYELAVTRLGNVFSFEDDFPILRQFTSLIDVFYHQKPISEPMLSHYLTTMLTQFLTLPTHTGSGDYTALMEQVVAYIGSNFSKNMTVEDMAGIAGLSPYYFIRVFRKHTGYTPHEYLIRQRMNHACYLLTSTDMSVKEICIDTGFSDESIFCNAFKKRYCVTPLNFRKNNT